MCEDGGDERPRADDPKDGGASPIEADVLRVIEIIPRMGCSVVLREDIDDIFGSPFGCAASGQEADGF